VTWGWTCSASPREIVADGACGPEDAGGLRGHGPSLSSSCPAEVKVWEAAHFHLEQRAKPAPRRQAHCGGGTRRRRRFRSGK
jgi:hypothetical protein